MGWLEMAGARTVTYGTCFLEDTECREYSRGSGHIHVDVLAAKFNGVTRDPSRLVGADLPGSHVVGPPVPGTGNDVPLQRALRERGSPVKAGVADRVKLASDVGHGNRRSVQLYFTDLTWSYIGCPSY